jgi:tRNA pseudouridine38-40 synthase
VRLRIDLGYDGTAFHGWAAQRGLRSVEETLSTALTTVLRAGEPIRITVAGRTDAGVHASGQVAHCDVDAPAVAALPGRSGHTPMAAARRRLNAVLPSDIVVHGVSVAPEGFDARFAALSRRYDYRIADGAARRDPLRRFDTVWRDDRLELDPMSEASLPLLGLRDFAAFCRRREGATTIRTLLDLSWRREDDGVVVATVIADAFCHSMVRALVGSLVEVGRGRAPSTWPAEVLARRARDPRSPVAPARGLTLVEVCYPDPELIAQRVSQARATRSEPTLEAGHGDHR